MKKIKTNVPGLDPLLHGGLQIDSMTGPASGDSQNSLVIVLRGKKGVSKHIFAMQLMHGIARSLGKRHKGRDPKALYFSINKNTEKLNDSYIDFLIADWLDFITRESHKETLGFGPRDPENTIRDDKRKTYELLFDSKLQKKGVYEELEAERERMFKEYDGKIIDFISDNILTYNPRTNSLHFRRPYMGDGPRNLWAVRNHDSIKEYLDDMDQNYNSLKTGNGTIAKHFREMFIKVDFNAHITGKDNKKTDSEFGDIGNIERYSKTANVIYEDILDHLEKLQNGEIINDSNGEKSNRESSSHEYLSKFRRNESDETKEKSKYDVIVIDGFSQFDDEHLKNLQFTTLHKVTRKLAHVTILVLDDREEALCDGDVIIELKKDEDSTQEYTYHQLQIVKSSFQEVANGWHQYKVQNDGVKVFPSIHFLLSKRYYMKTKTSEIGQSILEDSFEEYLDSKLHLANSNPDVELDVEGFHFKEYSETKKKHHSERFMKILENHKKWKFLVDTSKDENNEKEHFLLNQLSDVILGETMPVEDYCYNCPSKPSNSLKMNKEVGGVVDTCSINTFKCNREIKLHEEVNGWNRRYATTVIVGNPNSFKRRIALGKAYHWARRKEHVLIVLFGKNDDTLRKQLICPALQRAACAEKSQAIKDAAHDGCYPWLKNDEDKEEYVFNQNVYRVCSECDKYIHFFRIRMGCIAAEEIFFRLEEQIRTYSNEDPETGIERMRLHIIIDDLQRTDFGFPFIGDTSLFTGALINLCHEHKAELTMLCDKHSTRTREVSALADNVVVMDRNKDDIDRVSMYIEKCVEFPAPGAVMEFKINDVLNLFQCSCVRNTYLTPSQPSCSADKGESSGEGKGCDGRDVSNGKNDNANANTNGGSMTGTDNKEEPKPSENANQEEPKTDCKYVPVGLSIDFERIGLSKLRGSMREFWRHTSNTHLIGLNNVKIQDEV